MLSKSKASLFKRMLKRYLLEYECANTLSTVRGTFEQIRYTIDDFLYFSRAGIETFIFNLQNPYEELSSDGKSLYASPVGREGKGFLEKIIHRFGYDNFDFLIFAYDDTVFDEEIFARCIVIREKGLRWQFYKKHLTSEFCSKYKWIFLWPDDIDVDEFQPRAFLEIMARNRLECAQPSLSHRSVYSHKITLSNPEHRIGRYTDFVEIMIPVFTAKAWSRYWDMVESETNYWGWGYDLYARSLCRYSNMGIVDCMSVTHVKPLRDCHASREGMQTFLAKYKKCRQTKMLSYANLC